MTRLMVWTFAVLAMVSSVRAERTFFLSFDTMDRTPVKVVLKADEAKTPVTIAMSDSARLVKGVKGLGVYLDQRGDFLSFPGGSVINCNEGAVSFWVRPMWYSNDKRDKTFLQVDFEKGGFLLWSNSLGSMIADAKGKQHYTPGKSSAARGQNWAAGQWHHVVFNWSSTTKKLQMIVDGKARPAATYYPPAGKAGTVFLSKPPTDKSGRLPSCSVIDEFAIYDAPLSVDEAKSLYNKGVEALGDYAVNHVIEVSTYPNLVRGAKLTWTPKPNYGPPKYKNTCNDSDDDKQLTDGDWGTAHFSDKRSVGWTGCKGITIEYDLGAMKTIGAIAVNMGAGQAGPRFVKKVVFKAGVTPEKLQALGEVATAEPYPNPAIPKWHARRAGVAGASQFGQFVRVEFDGGGLFVDEVLVVEKGAEPVFVPIELSLEAPAAKAGTSAKVKKNGQ